MEHFAAIFRASSMKRLKIKSLHSCTLSSSSCILSCHHANVLIRTSNHWLNSFYNHFSSDIFNLLNFFFNAYKQAIDYYLK